MKRFWLENTLYYALHRGRPPLEGAPKRYLKAVKEKLKATRTSKPRP